MYSIQGVCVDESVVTSTSSVRRITEPAITHLPQAGGRHLELFQLREHSMSKAATQLAAAPSGPPAGISTTPVAVPKFFCSDHFFTNWKNKSDSDSP